MSQRISTLIAIFLIIIITGISGCNSTVSPVTPDNINQPRISGAGSSGKVNLGLWQFYIDPVNESVSFKPLRTAETHMNGLMFMEPPAGVALAIDEVVDFSPGQFTIDLAITHPYPGMNFATAFDVCGMLISHGTVEFPLWTKYTFAGEDAVRLLNPDGYLRWWNPIEFPPDAVPPHQGYIDGMLGTPLEIGQFDSTINPYKYFATELTTPDAPLSDLLYENRGVLRPGTSCIRRYEIGFPPGSLVFNYAVDANWFPAIPSGPGGEIIVPDDFPESANRSEAIWFETANINNTLTYDTSTGMGEGMCTMSIYVYDWFNPEENIVCPYSQNDEVMGFCSLFPPIVEEGYAVFDVELSPYMLESAGVVDLWYSIECEETDYQGFLPFERNTVFFRDQITVAEK